MKVESRIIDTVLRDEMAWHRTKTAREATAYTVKERLAFIRGLRQARLLLRKIVAELRSSNNVLTVSGGRNSSLEQKETRK
jgi:hypothetical protein